jgi:hypothetical protein
MTCFATKWATGNVGRLQQSHVGWHRITATEFASHVGAAAAAHVGAAAAHVGAAAAQVGAVAGRLVVSAVEHVGLKAEAAGVEHDGAVAADAEHDGAADARRLDMVGGKFAGTGDESL